MLVINKNDSSDSAEINQRNTGYSLSMHHKGYGDERRWVSSTDFQGSKSECLAAAQSLGLTPA